MKKCQKCGYERIETGEQPDIEWPNCGAIYSKVEALLAEGKIKPFEAKSNNAISPDPATENAANIENFGEENVKIHTLVNTSKVMTCIYSMKGVQDLLEVFDNKVTITPKGILGFLNKGLKGTKIIPFSSISAIQFKEAGVTSG